MKRLMRNFHESYLQTARDYAEAGFYGRRRPSWAMHRRMADALLL